MRLLAAAVTAIALCVPSVWSAEPHGFLLPLTAAKPLQDKDATPVPEPASSIDRSLAGKESHTYQMELSEGQYVGIVVVQRGIDVIVQVLDGGGQSLADFDSESRIEGQEEVGFVSDSAGVYRVRVKARYPRNSAGRYELKCLEVRAANEMDRGIYESHRLSTESGTLNDAGKYDEALDRAQRALDVGERALGPDDPFVGFLATRLGQALRTKGDLAKAETVAQRAVSINERTLGEGNPLTASAVQGLGLVYRSLDDNTKAEQLFQGALEIFEKSLGNDHPRTANCLMLLALEDEDRGDFDLAISMLQRALAIADKTVDPDEYLPMALVHNLGDIYLNQGDNERAEPLTRRALELAEKKYGPEHPNVAVPLQNLGSIERGKGEYAEALEMFSRARKIREKALGPQHPRTAALLLNIGNVYKDQGEYEKARELYQRALDVLQVSAGPYHTLTLMALANLSSVRSAMGDPERALEYQAQVNAVVEKGIELNLAVGSEREKLAYAASMAGRTNRMVSLHIQELPNNKRACELAAEVVLQRKARVFDAMSQNLAALRQRLGPDGQELLDDLATMTAKLANVALNGPGKTPHTEYSKELALLEQQREKLEGEISRRSAGYYEQTGAVTLAAVRVAIPADSVLVEFTVYRPYDAKVVDSGDKQFGDPRYAAYIIPSTGDVRWKDLGSAQDIDTAAQALREALRDPTRTDEKSLARALDERVMQPIRPLVGSATHLLLSPEGELNLVSFDVLLDEEERRLVENYLISYLTTGRDLLRMQVPRESHTETLVIANPLFGDPSAALPGGSNHEKQKSGSGGKGRRSITTGADLSSVYFSPLTGTAQEARNIQRLFPEARVLTGQQATERTLRQVEAPRILHIATHGFFLEDAGANASPRAKTAGASGTRAIHASIHTRNPLLRSGLALSGANLNNSAGDNGILTALEASGLNLWGTELVTLSACDTGVGQVKNGEGVFGLRRAFFLAGTETLVMSLWPVSDATTRDLMTDFYAGLKRGLGRGQALHQAQLAMLKRKGRDHAYYWGSFIESGEWANLDGRR